MEPVLSPQQTVAGLRYSYTVDRPIGTGGFGHTFLALRDDGTPVNLKVLRVDRMSDWKALELFEREARVLAAIDHPNIPRHHEYFAYDGARALPPGELGREAIAEERGRPLSLILVQDYVEGRSLQEWIDDDAPLSGLALEAILRTLLDVLTYLHGLHPPLVHRDIKPSNIILTSDGRPFLIDFGAIQTRLHLGTAMGSTAVGTFGFFPMEQIMGKACPASDLYALGMTMVVTASHTPPERLPIDPATGKVRIDEVAPHLDPRLRQALDAMLEPIVGNRVHSARAAVELLDRPQHRALTQRSGPHRHGYQWLWAATIGVGGIGAGLLYLVFFDALSERALVRLSVLWLVPIVFGVGGIAGEGSARRHPMATAFLWAGLGSIVLVAFIYGVWPAL